MKSIWLINVDTNQDDCSSKLYDNGLNPMRIGIDETFNHSSILCYIIFMSFGASYSLVEVDSIEWVYSSARSKILRLLLASVFVGVLDYIIVYLLKSEIAFQLAHFCIIPFIMYGPFIVWCQKLGLVDNNWAKQQKERALSRQSSSISNSTDDQMKRKLSQYVDSNVTSIITEEISDEDEDEGDKNDMRNGTEVKVDET